MSRTLKMVLNVDSRKGVKSVQNVTKSVTKMDSKTKKAGKSMAKVFAGLTVAVVGVVAAIKAVSGAYEFLKESIKLSNEQIKAETKLAAVIKATGHAAGLTMTQMTDYAEELQKITTYGDEVTISAMSMLATFKNIKGDVFKRTTKAMLDMSIIMEQDLKTSAIQLGKALNDPIKGMSALTRVGVTFTEQQIEMVNKMVEAGDVIGAQELMLKELESQFGGAAEAMRNTMGGAIIGLQNAWGDLREVIGDVFTDIVDEMMLTPIP